MQELPSSHPLIGMPCGLAGTKLRMQEDKSKVLPRPHLFPQISTGDLPRISRKPTAGPALTTTQQAPLDLRAQALLPNATQCHPTLPNIAQGARRSGLDFAADIPSPAQNFTFAIWGILGSLLNPARGILSCNVFTLDLAKKKKRADIRQCLRQRDASCSPPLTSRAAWMQGYSPGWWETMFCRICWAWFSKQKLNFSSHLCSS